MLEGAEALVPGLNYIAVDRAAAVIELAVELTNLNTLAIFIVSIATSEVKYPIDPEINHERTVSGSCPNPIRILILYRMTGLI